MDKRSGTELKQVLPNVFPTLWLVMDVEVQIEVAPTMPRTEGPAQLCEHVTL